MAGPRVPARRPAPRVRGGKGALAVMAGPRVRRLLRVRYALALLVATGAVAWLIVGPLRSNIVYFRTVSEALAERDAGRFRLAGQVVEGSVREVDGGVLFRVTDGAAEATVFHRGDPPELFREGVPVVCEGRWDGDRFASDRILIRHGNEYRPPEVTTTVGGSG